MLDVVLIAPTVRPMLVRALVAFACGWFVTSGTATCGKPEEITSATALPTTTSVATAGIRLKTKPAGKGLLDARLIDPRTRGHGHARRRADCTDRQTDAGQRARRARLRLIRDVRHCDVRQARR